MLDKPLRVGVVGCGNIAGGYARTLAAFDKIELVGAADMLPERAESFVAEHGGQAYASLEALLADETVELVINLTIHQAHAEVIRQCLQAGKHVHSEKPLALTYQEAGELVDLAQRQGLRLGSAPITFMGEAQQTAWKLIRDGKLGPVRVIYAEVNWGRIESWHPAPGPFYEVGPLWDVGVYPLTIVTAMFGPARRVTAYGKVLYPDRVTKEGVPFHIDTPDWMVAAIELDGGPVVRLTTDFYVGQKTKQKGIEFHGDTGSLYLDSWQNFDARVEYAAWGEAYEPVPLVREPFKGTEWSRSVEDLRQALAQDRPHRATGEQAAHVVEILEAISRSSREGQPVEVSSSFRPPAPMEWAM